MRKQRTEKNFIQTCFDTARAKYYPAIIYLFKVKNARKKCEISSKLTR